MKRLLGRKVPIFKFGIFTNLYDNDTADFYEIGSWDKKIGVVMDVPYRLQFRAKGVF